MMFYLRALPGFAGILMLGLMSGFFFAFTTPVMTALAKLDGPAFITVFNHINIDVRNTVFPAVFFAPLPLLAGAAWNGRGRRLLWIGALLIYLLVVILTASINVPINDYFKTVDPATPPADWQTLRDRWIWWNQARTVLTSVAFALGLGAFISGAR